MGARLRSILVVAIILVVVIALIIIGYRFDWTGFNGNSKSGKTLWDWLQLLGVLAIPVVVGFGAVWFTTRQGKVAAAENKDNQRETALQAYIDKMSELLLHEKLRDSSEEDEVRKIARVRTLTILRGLDPIRKASVIQFLHESGLIDKDKCIISLREADLHGADLRGAYIYEAILNHADLREADLRGAYLREADLVRAKLSGAKLSGASFLVADLRGADLNGADLSQADLTHADLSGVNLSKARLWDASLNRAILERADLRDTDFKGGDDLDGANLELADLSRANLKGAKITQEQLDQTKWLTGATMPDGSLHD